MLDQILADPTKVGAISLMAVAITALMRGWVVTAGHHTAVIAQYETRVTQLLAEKNEFKDMVVRSVETTERALTVASGLADKGLPDKKTGM